MNTHYLIFEGVLSVEDAIREFQEFNRTLDIGEWDFESVSFGKVIASPKNKRLFFAKSPCHFGWWVNV